LVSYYDYTRKQRYELGITDTLFRLAVGLEDTQDIIDDLNRALN
jgi:cystathionine beta-lyase/cystathionine gamma-synthase